MCEYLAQTKTKTVGLMLCVAKAWTERIFISTSNPEKILTAQIKGGEAFFCILHFVLWDYRQKKQ